MRGRYDQQQILTRILSKAQNRRSHIEDPAGALVVLAPATHVMLCSRLCVSDSNLDPLKGLSGY